MSWWNAATDGVILASQYLLGCLQLNAVPVDRFAYCNSHNQYLACEAWGWRPALPILQECLDVTGAAWCVQSLLLGLWWVIPSL
jgi:hypothetical protein